MVQLNPVPVFGAQKKYQYHLTEIFHRYFRTYTTPWAISAILLA